MMIIMLFVRVRLFQLLPVMCLQFSASLAIDSIYYKTALRGTNVTLPCNHTEQFDSADWVRPRKGNVPEKEMCLNGICLNGYARRLSVDKNNRFQLTIRDVIANDSGQYVCIAYDGFTDHRYTTELIVTAHAPNYQTAFTGTNVTIPCNHREPFDAADWVRPRSENAPEKELCLNGICPNGYAHRFSVNKENKFQLTIRNVTVNDSGEYECIAYDGFTDYRYTTKLIVTDRQLESEVAQSVTTTTLPPEDSSPVVLISLAVIVSICAGTLVVIFVVITLLRRKKNIENNYMLTDTMEYDAKIFQSQYDEEKMLSADPKSQQANIIEYFAVIGGARLLTLSFLKRFRETYNGSNKSVSAATAFRLLASSSPLWLNKLIEKNAAKRRIRRLIYYECSAYNPSPVRLDLLKPALANNQVMAVAILGGSVYTISRDSDTVLVGFDRNRSIRVVDMKHPVDIVACTSAHKLYIADEQRCIWRVSVGEDQTEKWQEIRSKMLPRTLSTYRGAVLVTTDTNVLLKFSGNGGGKVVNLPVNMEPYHAVETSRNTFVVCCRLGRGVQVAEVGSDGRPIRKFVCVLQLLRNPSYVVLDREGRLLVADSVNSKILLLDSKLKYSHTVLSRDRDGIAAPQRLCFDDSTGQLYVVQRSNHSVEVFEVRTPKSQRLGLST